MNGGGGTCVPPKSSQSLCDPRASGSHRLGLCADPSATGAVLLCVAYPYSLAPREEY